MPIGGDLFRRRFGNRLSVAEETLSRRHIPVGAEHRVHQIAFPVDGAIQITLPCFYVHVRFVCYQRRPTLPLRLRRICSASGAKRSSHSRTASCVNSKPHSRRICARFRRLRLYRTGKARSRRRCRSELEEVEGLAGSLIELASAVATPKYNVAEISRAIQLPDLGRLAMRTNHECRAGNSEYRTRPPPFRRT